MRTTIKGTIGVVVAVLALTGCGPGPSMNASPSPEPTAEAPNWQPTHGTVSAPLTDDKNSVAQKWTDKGTWSSTSDGAEAYTYYSDPNAPDMGMTAVLFPAAEQCESRGSDPETTLSGIAFNSGVSELRPGQLGSNAAKNSARNQLVDFDGSMHLVGASEVGTSPVVATRAVQAVRDPLGPGHTVNVYAAIVEQPDGSYFTNSCAISYTNRLNPADDSKTGTWSQAVSTTRELAESVSMTS